jgi:hypothetical protein
MGATVVSRSHCVAPPFHVVRPPFHVASPAGSTGDHVSLPVVAGVHVTEPVATADQMLELPPVAEYVSAAVKLSLRVDPNVPILA